MSNSTEQDVRAAMIDEANNTTTPWGWFGSAAVAIVVAVLCFTPVWEQVAPTELRDGGRRAGFSNLLYQLGPTGVAAIVAGIAVICVLVGMYEIRSTRKEAATAAPSEHR